MKNLTKKNRDIILEELVNDLDTSRVLLRKMEEDENYEVARKVSNHYNKVEYELRELYRVNYVKEQDAVLKEAYKIIRQVEL